MNEVMVVMRDGVRLQTVIYLPDSNEEKYPVILLRTCYPGQDSQMREYGEEFAKRGYAFVYQFCRGQMRSEGIWEPNIHERNDGIDTVNWICEQPWAGRVGVMGNSYSALAGWAMADAVTGKVASMFLGVYGTDRFVSAYQHGSFRHDILTSWTMDNAGFPIHADYLESCKFMPQIQVDKELWGKEISWYRDYIVNSDIEDDYWQSGWWKQLREIPAKTEIPLCIVSGWYDHHHGSTMVTWDRLGEMAKRHSRLVVGGWNHAKMSCLEGLKTEANVFDEIKNVLDWFELTLVKNELPESEICLYECGNDCWYTYQSMNDVKTRKIEYYLDAQREYMLTTKKTDVESSVDYLYAPKNPVMSHGAEAMLKSWDEIGSLRQPEENWREDVISFVSNSLTEPLRIMGKIELDLYVKSDCEDTAFTAKVMEVRADGHAYNIRSSITSISYNTQKNQKYVPNTPVKVALEMWDIMYTLQRGSRLRIDISSSDFPQYNIHSNHAGNWSMQTDTLVASQTILCGGEYSSVIRIPKKI